MFFAFGGSRDPFRRFGIWRLGLSWKVQGLGFAMYSTGNLRKLRYAGHSARDFRVSRVQVFITLNPALTADSTPFSGLKQGNHNKELSKQ